MTAWAAAFLASLAAGFLSAMGLGGGGVLVLYLTLVQGFDQTKAGGVNLLFFLPAAAVALCIHLRRGQVDWRMALRCLPFGLTPPARAGLERYFLTAIRTLGDLNMATTVQPRSRRRRFTPSSVTVALISMPLGV